MANNTYFMRHGKMMPFAEEDFLDRVQNFNPVNASGLTPIGELGNDKDVGTDKAPAKVSATLTANDVGFQFERNFSYPPVVPLAGVDVLDMANFSFANMIVGFKNGSIEEITHCLSLPRMAVQSVDYNYAYDTPGTISLSLQGSGSSLRRGAPYHDIYAIAASQAATYVPVQSSSQTGSKYTLWACIYDPTDYAFNVVWLQETPNAPNAGQIRYDAVGGDWELNAADVVTYAGMSVKVGFITADPAAATIAGTTYDFTKDATVKGVYIVVTYGGTLKAAANPIYKAGYSPSTDNILGGYELLRCQSMTLTNSFTTQDIGELGSQVRDGVDVIAIANQLESISGTLNFNETDEVIKFLNFITNQNPGTDTFSNEYTYAQFQDNQSLHISIRDVDDVDTVLKEFWIPEIIFANDGGVTGAVNSFVTKAYSFNATKKVCFVKGGKLLSGDIPAYSIENRDP